MQSQGKPEWRPRGWRAIERSGDSEVVWLAGIGRTRSRASRRSSARSLYSRQLKSFSGSPLARLVVPLEVAAWALLRMVCFPLLCVVVVSDAQLRPLPRRESPLASGRRCCFGRYAPFGPLVFVNERRDWVGLLTPPRGGGLLPHSHIEPHQAGALTVLCCLVFHWRRRRSVQRRLSDSKRGQQGGIRRLHHFIRVPRR